MSIEKETAIAPDVIPERWVRHWKFGVGRVIERIDQDQGELPKFSFPRVRVEFTKHGSKWLALRLARLEVLQDVYHAGYLSQSSFAYSERNGPIGEIRLAPLPEKKKKFQKYTSEFMQDTYTAGNLSTFFEKLATRIEQGEELCPTLLMKIQFWPLSEFARLKFRLWFLERIYADFASKNQQEWLPSLKKLKHLLRQRISLKDEETRKQLNHEAEILATKLYNSQPGTKRISIHASRRIGPDQRLLFAERIAKSMNWRMVSGAWDYFIVVDWICKQPDYRYRFIPSATDKLRFLANYWREFSIRRGRPRLNRYRQFLAILRNVADKFSNSAEHYHCMWCALNPNQVEIDLLTGKVTPEPFAILRNEILAGMCRDTLARNIKTLGIRLESAILLLVPTNRPNWNGFDVIVTATTDTSRTISVKYES